MQRVSSVFDTSSAFCSKMWNKSDLNHSVYQTLCVCACAPQVFKYTHFLPLWFPDSGVDI